MPFKKGQVTNPKGRPKGSTREYILKKNFKIAETLDANNCDPILKMVEIINTSPDNQLVLKAIEVLMPYFMSKLKSIEHKIDDGMSLAYNIHFKNKLNNDNPTN